MGLSDDPYPFRAGDLPRADHFTDWFDQDLGRRSLEGAQASIPEGGKHLGGRKLAPLCRMGNLVRAEGVDIDLRGDLVHRGDQPDMHCQGQTPG